MRKLRAFDPTKLYKAHAQRHEDVRPKAASASPQTRQHRPLSHFLDPNIDALKKIIRWTFAHRLVTRGPLPAVARIDCSAALLPRGVALEEEKGSAAQQKRSNSAKASRQASQSPRDDVWQGCCRKQRQRCAQSHTNAPGWSWHESGQRGSIWVVLIKVT